jgi:hypothetical protein
MLQQISRAITASRAQRPRREKVFGEGRSIPLDRNAKVRIKAFARALMHRTEKGKHYGILTSKFIEVLDALIWGFHNCQTGRCFPSYERIAERAHCARSTVYEAIHALEKAGILTWVNRVKRIREWGEDLFGRAQNRVRVIRTSNAYVFVDPKPTRPGCSKSESQTRTAGQDSKKEAGELPTGALGAALARLGAAVMMKSQLFDGVQATGKPAHALFRLPG